MARWLERHLAAILVLGSLGLAAVALSTCGALPAQAFDSGQYAQVAPEKRAWFKAQKSPKGVPCCDLADGHVLDGSDVDTASGHYRVRVEGQWVDVPPEALIEDHGNPNGGAVVWYGFYSGKPWVRCFVPGGGV